MKFIFVNRSDENQCRRCVDNRFKQKPTPEINVSEENILCQDCLYDFLQWNQEMRMTMSTMSFEKYNGPPGRYKTCPQCEYDGCFLIYFRRDMTLVHCCPKCFSGEKRTGFKGEF